MKARTRKTRWLLITLLFGFLAVAGGLTLVLHRHPGNLLVNENGTLPSIGSPDDQSQTTAPISIADPQTLQAAAGVHPDGDVADDGHSNINQSDVTGYSGTQSIGFGGGSGTAGANYPAGTMVGSRGGAQAPVNHPSTSNPTQPADTGGGEFANSGTLPFGCGLPAGCGGGGAAVIRQTSGTSGGTPSLHDSPGSSQQTDGSDPQPGNSSQQTGNPDPTGSDGNQQSAPSSPGSGGSVAAAPELDSATLAGAITLLFGALAIVRGRRVRATR